MNQEDLLPDDKKVNPETGREIVPNYERGCGFKDDEAAYFRMDVSENGVLPAFVEFDKYQEYNEGHFRGYKEINGDRYEKVITENGTNTIPEGEFEDHMNRVATLANPTHFGSTKEATTFDYIMHIGSSYYETPEEFIKECKTIGLNKRVPVSKNKIPEIIPGRTRIFFVHPNAMDDGEQPAVIGYSYVTRIIWVSSEKGDGHNPSYIEDWEKTGKIDIVEKDEEIPETSEEHLYNSEE